MFTTKLYYTTETAVRVREDYWFDCEENREQIHQLAWCFNGDDNHPRSKPLTIYIMDADNLGCVGFIDPQGKYSPKLAELTAAAEMEAAA